MSTSEGPKWLPQAHCHFKKIHESFWEKGELWRCKWCEKFLKEFEVLGKVPENPDHYWATHKYNGHIWKIKGTESFKPGAFNVKDTLNNARDFLPKRGV